MRKVLYTASTYSHIRNFHRPYLSWFHKEGWEVHVAAGGEASGVPEADDCLSLPFAKRMTAPSNFHCAKLLGRRMEEEGYDLVVTHTALAAFFTRLPLLRRRERPRVVNMVHGYLFDEGTPFVKRNILLNAERLTAPCTDLLLTMNQSDQEIARRYRLGGRLANIPGVGVAYGRIDNTPSEEGMYSSWFTRRSSPSGRTRRCSCGGWPLCQNRYGCCCRGREPAWRSAVPWHGSWGWRTGSVFRDRCPIFPPG